MHTFARSAVWLFCIGIAVPGAAAADVVYLKDGSRVETERAWIEDGAVHFLLPGTRTVVIRYSREIVDRVETGAAPAGPPPASEPPAGRDAPPSPPEAAGEAAVSSSPPKEEAPVERASLPDAAPGREQGPGPGAAAGIGTAAPPADISRLEGIAFYNPRRQKRYWTDDRRHHETYLGALEALARQYDRTPAWVESHMGASNDLARIHQSLAAGEAPPGALQTNADPPDVRRHEGIDFYNPRRAQRYWARHDSRHDTLRQAVEALGHQYGRTPEWVESHMGASNDLGRIHRNLIEAGSHPHP